MVTTRRASDLTRVLPNNKRARDAGGETTESLITGDLLGDSNQDILTKLSDEVALNMSKSVASLVLSNGDYAVTLLTSASLVKALNQYNLGCGSLKIKVHLEGGEVHMGSLSRFYSHHNFAVVNVMTSLDVHVVPFKREEEISPHSNVVAAGRDISGKLITKSVILTGDLSKSEERGLMMSKYKSEAWEGGALFDRAGNFVGMNIFLVMEKSFFLPRTSVVIGMERFWKSQPMVKKGPFPYPKHFKAASHRTLLISNHLAFAFEENFGDEYGKGFWMEFSNRASNNINRSVVALASFSENTRLFTCTGFFIEWNGSTPILTSASLVTSSHDENTIYENMRIEVLLPNKQRIEGTLQHYSLHYNIALVNVKNYRARWPADIEPRIFDGYSIVAAVGRCFNSGTLMAADGLLKDWSGTLDCKALSYSSCRITKAGIGGPLVALNGKFLGMNLIDKKIGTPFMLWKDIAKVLSGFKKKGKSTVAGGGNNFASDAHGDSVRPNRWHVPNPDEYDSGVESDTEFAARYGGSVKDITYINGKR